MREKYNARRAAEQEGKGCWEVDDTRAAAEPVFFFIDDLQDFFAMVNEQPSFAGEITGPLETILGKCRGLRVYFIAATTAVRAVEFADMPLFRYFKNEDSGMVMGIRPTEQSMLNFDFMGFRDQSKEPGPQLAFINRPEDRSVFTVRIPYTS